MRVGLGHISAVTEHGALWILDLSDVRWPEYTAKALELLGL